MKNKEIINDEKTRFDELQNNQNMENATSNPNSLGTAENKAKKSSDWKRAAVGAGMGVILGGVTSFAITSAGAHTSDSDEISDNMSNLLADGEIPFASNISDDMSFNEAFEAAREEVGPAGAFEWRGNIYSTYTVGEWNEMTPEQKDEYYAHFNWASSDDDEGSDDNGEDEGSQNLTGEDANAAAGSGSDAGAASAADEDANATAGTGSDAGAASAAGGDANAAAGAGSDTGAASAAGGDANATAGTGSDAGAASAAGGDANAATGAGSDAGAATSTGEDVGATVSGTEDAPQNSENVETVSLQETVDVSDINLTDEGNVSEVEVLSGSDLLDDKDVIIDTDNPGDVSFNPLGSDFMLSSDPMDADYVNDIPDGGEMA